MSTEEIKVLLVEDNPDDTAIMRRLLGQFEDAHFVVEATNSTSNCLPMLQGEGADLVFLDYSMPEEDGLTFLRRASTLFSMPPVIIVTGKGDHRLVVEAIRSGASDCIYKHSMTSQTLGVAATQALIHFQHETEFGRYSQNVIEALIRTCAHVDPTTGGRPLAELAEMLGRAMGLSDHEVQTLGEAAILHDVGKLGVRNELIFKPGPLTEKEFEEVRLHPIIGEKICLSLHFARDLAPLIRHHHERWDGNGYVDGLAGEEIPLLARIISVVDAFNAMTTDRPYRHALPIQTAIARLRRGAGSQWDPAIVSVFLEQLEQPRQLAYNGV